MISTTEQAKPGAGEIFRFRYQGFFPYCDHVSKSTNIFPDTNTSVRIVSILACADNSDVWHGLGQLMDDHPQWSDDQCISVIHSCINMRASNFWQRKLLTFWQRWKQHHRDLEKGLKQAGHLTWAQKCHYCEVWSANRPVMSPFCGVAEILLDFSKTEIGKPSSNLQVKKYPSGAIERAPPQINKTVLQSEIIVISSDATIEEFSEFGGSRQLIWALNNCGYSWSLYQPWSNHIEINPDTVKGVIFWSYRHRSNDFVHHALTFERACREHQIPVLNSMMAGWDVRHSTILESFQQAGIRCPKFQKCTTVDDITLSYPLILRLDGVHSGQQMYLVQNPEEARALLNQKRIEFLCSDGGSQAFSPPNLAVEFIDITDGQGRFHKCRAYVIGNEVILRHKVINTNWLVNFSSSESTECSENTNRDFIRGRGEDMDLLARAGQASGSDVTALDYSKTQNGEYVFWEANRLFKMNGDKGYALSELASDSKTKKRAARDRKLGKSLLALLQQRFICSVN